MFKEKFETLERSLVKAMTDTLLTQRFFTLIDQQHPQVENVALTAAEALQIEGVEDFVYEEMCERVRTAMWGKYDIAARGVLVDSTDEKLILRGMDDDPLMVDIRRILDWVGALLGVEDPDTTANEIREACDLLGLPHTYNGVDLTDAASLLLSQATSKGAVPKPLVRWAKEATDEVHRHITNTTKDIVFSVIGIKRRQD